LGNRPRHLRPVSLSNFTWISIFPQYHEEPGYNRTSFEYTLCRRRYSTIWWFLLCGRLRRKWSSEDKYLSSQKVAFLGFALFGGVLLISGAVKVAAHIWPINADYWAFFTVLHDLFSLLFIFLLIVHVLLVLGLREWPALASWVTGKVTEERAEEDYPVWHKELKTGKRRGYKLLGYKEGSEGEE